MPVIGFLHRRRGLPPAWISPGLEDAGFIEGENVAIEYRFKVRRCDNVLGSGVARTEVGHERCAWMVL
jgi:hypothetical protein